MGMVMVKVVMVVMVKVMVMTNDGDGGYSLNLHHYMDKVTVEFSNRTDIPVELVGRRNIVRTKIQMIRPWTLLISVVIFSGNIVVVWNISFLSYDEG